MKKLNKSQTERLSEIAGNMGILFFGTMILPIFSGASQTNSLAMTAGAILTFISWFLSINLLKGGNK